MKNKSINPKGKKPKRCPKANYTATQEQTKFLVMIFKGKLHYGNTRHFLLNCSGAFFVNKLLVYSYL